MHIQPQRLRRSMNADGSSALQWPTRSHISPIYIVMTLCLAAAVTACSEPASKTAAAPEAPVTANVQSNQSESESDFESFFWPDTSDERAYSLELESRIADCMKDRGFAYPAVTAGADEAPQQPSNTASTEPHYGLVDSILNGGETSADGASSALRTYIDGLPEVERQQYEIALWGDPADVSSTPKSCTTKASDEMASSIPRFQAQYQRILTDYYSRLRSDPRVAAATVEWSRCLERATGLLRTTGSPLVLSRSNVALAARADLAVRVGKSVRWLTEAEADQLDTSGLTGPEVSLDETGVGLLVHGTAVRVDPASVARARARERQISSASEACWFDSGGSAAVADLQADAMKEAEPLIAAVVD